MIQETIQLSFDFDEFHPPSLDYAAIRRSSRYERRKIKPRRKDVVAIREAAYREIYGVAFIGSADSWEQGIGLDVPNTHSAYM
jgi:hypothetical protein